MFKEKKKKKESKTKGAKFAGSDAEAPDVEVLTKGPDDEDQSTDSELDRLWAERANRKNSSCACF